MLLFFCSFFFFYLYGDHLDLHLMTPSFPTRRSSDLTRLCQLCRRLYRSRRRPHHARGRRTGLRRRQIVEHRADRLEQSRNRRRGEARSARRQRDLFLVVEQGRRSEEHTSELQSLMRISYAVFCLKKKKQQYHTIDKRTT